MTDTTVPPSWDSPVGQEAIRDIRLHIAEIARMFGTISTITIFVHFPDGLGADLLITTADSTRAAADAIRAHLESPEAKAFDIQGKS